MHKILIVDDETGIRESLQAVLADEGYETASVESGEECLKLLRREHTYEVVLLDIWLPGIDGLETLESIHEMDEPSRSNHDLGTRHHRNRSARNQTRRVRLPGETALH